MNHTPQRRATLIRQITKRLADLRAKGQGKNSRRANIIKQLEKQLRCLNAGDHFSNWPNY